MDEEREVIRSTAGVVVVAEDDYGGIRIGAREDFGDSDIEARDLTFMATGREALVYAQQIIDLVREVAPNDFEEFADDIIRVHPTTN